MSQPLPTLANQLTASTQRMADLLTPLTDEQFFAQKNGKWSSAETLQHLFLAARALPRIMTGPRTLFEQWPRSGRLSRPYDAMAAIYTHTLQTNAIKAPASLVARPEDIRIGKAELLSRFTATHQALAESLAGWSADELDTYQIPHPALGLITVGEMMHFTAYHIEHHRAIEASLL